MGIDERLRQLEEETR